MKIQEIIALVNETKTPQIKAGETHRFNDIWMVIADNRIFCRQYSFSSKSWYTTFLDSPNGYIKCGDTIIKVQGKIPADLDTINPKVNEAYIEKYDKRLDYYPEIAHQMTGKRYMEKTMELIPVEE